MDGVRLFLAGDVMTGRGVDQVLPHPGDPRLAEAYVADARTYVRLAEAAAGAPVPRRVAYAWPWGDALAVLDAARPHARVVNLETAVTSRGDFVPGKTVHYRMNPANLPCLTAARLDVCVLANNHAGDFGEVGLHDTVTALEKAGLHPTGAGADADRAGRPAVVDLDGRRLVVGASGSTTSGVPPSWAAGPDQPGVDLLPDLSPATADRFAERLHRAARPGDLLVASLHWGSNWGYAVTSNRVAFARRLIDAGVHVVHGHSSHHPGPLEVHHGRLILYGCGDLVNDYEGITGHEEYRGDLRLLYLVTLDPDDGRLRELRMVPMRTHRLQLRHADAADTAHLQRVLETASAPFGTRIARDRDGALVVHPPPG